MKPLLFIVVGLGLLISTSPVVISAAAKEKVVPENAAPHGSIRPKGKPKATERAALAKISFQAAFLAASAAVPGRVVYGELEVEDGNLEYDFQIITPAGKVMDVGIDAGNGKVLSIDEGDDE